jgi:protein required for attachment to host cells
MKNSPHTYWIVVADSGSARILEMHRKGAECKEVHRLESETQHKPTRELVSDSSGRAFNAKGPGSHAKAQRSDAHDLAEQNFIRKLVDKLDLAAGLGAFAHLVVIADPKTLGRLRRGMGKSLKAKLKDEWNVDLVKEPLDLLQKRVRARLGWAA